MALAIVARLQGYQIPSLASHAALIKQRPPVSPPTFQPININGIRSVTYWDPNKRLGCSADLKNDLAAQIPKIKETGFNAVWLVSWWECFSPQAFPAPKYDSQAFGRVREILQLLKDNNLKAVLPLNYVATIPGTSVDFCSILRYRKGSDSGYAALTDYVRQYLTEIEQYSDTTVIMLFTEGMVCDAYENPPIQSSQLLRTTLGRLPLDLPQALRNKFTIGFHDFVFRWSEPAALTTQTAPTPTPSPYNFFSYAFYAPDDSYLEYIPTATALGNRLKTYYGQSTPIFNGELGVSYCHFGGAKQSDFTTKLVANAMAQGNGFNVWQWKGYSCSSSGADGFYLNDAQQSALPVRNAIKKLLTGSDATPLPPVKTNQPTTCIGNKCR